MKYKSKGEWNAVELFHLPFAFFFIVFYRFLCSIWRYRKNVVERADICVKPENGHRVYIFFLLFIKKEFFCLLVTTRSWQRSKGFCSQTKHLNRTLHVHLWKRLEFLDKLKEKKCLRIFYDGKNVTGTATRDTPLFGNIAFTFE